MLLNNYEPLGGVSGANVLRQAFLRKGGASAGGTKRRQNKRRFTQKRK